MEQNRKPRNKPTQIQLLFSKGASNTQRGRIILSTNYVGKTEYPHAKECDWTLILNHMQTSTQNGLKT